MQALQSQYIGLYSKLDNFIKAQAGFPQEVAERVNTTLAAARPKEVIVQPSNTEELDEILGKVADLSEEVECGNMDVREILEAVKDLCAETKRLVTIEKSIGNAVDDIVSIKEEVMSLKRKSEAISTDTESDSDVQIPPAKPKVVIDVDADPRTEMDVDADVDGPPPKKRTKTAKTGLDGTSMIMGALAGSLIAFAGVIFSA